MNPHTLSTPMTLEATLMSSHQRMLAVAFRILQNLEDAEDVVQHASLKASQAWGSFQWKSSPNTWLHKIVENLAINSLKSRGVRGRYFTPENEDHPINEEVGNSDVVREVELNELRMEIEAAMDKLSKGHRLIVQRCCIDGIGCQQLSEELGLPEGTVRSRLYYAKKILQEKLEDKKPVKNKMNKMILRGV